MPQIVHVFFQKYRQMLSCSIFFSIFYDKSVATPSLNTWDPNYNVSESYSYIHLLYDKVCLYLTTFCRYSFSLSVFDSKRTLVYLLKQCTANNVITK